MDLDTVSESFRAYQASEVSKVVHPEDLMYNTGPDHYFAVGLSAMQIIYRALSLCWLSSVTSVLDLPCGHGRIARHLKAAFPKARFFFSDIDRSGVDFCAKTYNGTGIYSDVDLTKVAFPTVDLIWVGSLFTHVDRTRTQAWMRHMAQHLKPQGILVATFHGIAFKERTRHQPLRGGIDWDAVLDQYHRTGFGYVPYTELDLGDYGVSLSKASVIMDMATSIPETRVLGYMERGWADNHDVLILAKNDRLRDFV